jgi:hypothetical protein
MSTNEAPQADLTTEVVVVSTYLNLMFQKRAALFLKDTCTNHWQDLEEIMGALQAWRHKTTEQRTSRADYLYHSKVIGSWVAQLHADHLGKTAE